MGAGSSLNSRDLEKLAYKWGFRRKRVTGGHAQLHHPDHPGVVTLRASGRPSKNVPVEVVDGFAEHLDIDRATFLAGPKKKKPPPKETPAMPTNKKETPALPTNKEVPPPKEVIRVRPGALAFVLAIAQANEGIATSDDIERELLHTFNDFPELQQKITDYTYEGERISRDWFLYDAARWVEQSAKPGATYTEHVTHEVCGDPKPMPDPFLWRDTPPRVKGFVPVAFYIDLDSTMIEGREQSVLDVHDPRKMARHCLAAAYRVLPEDGAESSSKPLLRLSRFRQVTESTRMKEPLDASPPETPDDQPERTVPQYPVREYEFVGLTQAGERIVRHAESGNLYRLERL
jgi:predicted RNA binding protein YcfA (HicA-like mRNA interferase family)